LTLDDLEVRYALLWLNGCEIGPKLLLIVNMKWHTLFQMTQMTQQSSTLDDLES